MARASQMVVFRFLRGYFVGVNITIKSIPEAVGAALKREAERAYRSLNGEIIHRLSHSLAAGSSAVPATPDTVADAWSALAGRWKSDLSVETEISQLYETRSAGRDTSIQKPDSSLRASLCALCDFAGKTTTPATAPVPASNLPSFPISRRRGSSHGAPTAPTLSVPPWTTHTSSNKQSSPAENPAPSPSPARYRVLRYNPVRRVHDRTHSHEGSPRPSPAPFKRRRPINMEETLRFIDVGPQPVQRQEVCRPRRFPTIGKPGRETHDFTDPDEMRQ